MKKRIILLFCCLCAICLFCGCQKKQEEEVIPENSLKLYYLNAKEDGLVSVYKEIDLSNNIIEDAKQILEVLKENDEEEKKYQSVINKQISITHVASYEEECVTIDFGPGYYQMNSREEILLRAAIVKSLVQADTISNVYFTVEGEPLTNVEGFAIGIMNDNTFVLDNNKSIVYDTSQTVSVYLANQKGNGLVEVEMELEAKDNESIESAVLNALRNVKIKGTQNTISVDVLINRINVIQKVCYVDFSEEFENSMTGIEEPVRIFSIVNSLTSLERVSQVQITINGEVRSEINGVYGLDRPMNCDYTYVVDEK